MTFPVDWKTVSVTGQFIDLMGKPLSGVVYFQSGQVLTQDGVLIVAPCTFSAVLDSTGSFAINLPSTDDPTLNIQTWAYNVLEAVPGGRAGYAIFVPHASTGINLATVAPVVPPPQLVSTIGPRGPQGIQGPQGDQGIQGLPGDTGPQGNSLNRPVATLTPSAGVATINVTTGAEVYTLTLAANVTSWVFNNLPTAGTVAEIRIKVIQAVSGGPYTVVSPATAGNTAGGAWVNSSAAGAVESIGLAIDSAGTVAVFPSGVYA